VTAFAELDRPTVSVTPGEEATLVLAVRNDSDIVEAYGFEVLGECAPWTTVEPARLSLYPGTAENVTVRLRPPRSPEVLAGEKPLGVRVLPAERPQNVTVSESTVVVEAFQQTYAELEPLRRRAWRSARYSVALRNLGNTPVTLTLAAAESEEQLRFRFPERIPEIGPGVREQVRLRARARALIWFGKPETRAFRITANPVVSWPVEPDPPERHDLDGELVQLALLPRWLLALLAALLALVLVWFTLVRPTIRSEAGEAADERAREIAAEAPQPPAGDEAGATPPAGGGEGAGDGAGEGGGEDAGAGGPEQGQVPARQQNSETIEVRTNPGGTGTRSYTVPPGKVFHITDILLANPQGDEGLLTIVFGRRTITRIALETFRNQDYHWVTPIQVPQGATVDARVNCARAGTPATGVPAPNCLQLLNVSGELVDLPR
jgi:hypothetical protein